MAKQLGPQGIVTQPELSWQRQTVKWIARQLAAKKTLVKPVANFDVLDDTEEYPENRLPNSSTITWSSINTSAKPWLMIWANGPSKIADSGSKPASCVWWIVYATPGWWSQPQRCSPPTPYDSISPVSLMAPIINGPA